MLCADPPNHLTGIAPETVVAPDELEQVVGRSMVVRRLAPIMVEAVVRGYLIGSGWKDYQASGSVCGIALPAGLQLAQKLPEPIFTPARKAEHGEHDENISFEAMVAVIGEPLATRIREVSLTLYSRAAAYAATRGILIADTKFEFGLDEVCARLSRVFDRLGQNRTAARPAARGRRAYCGQVS